jgi:hypothetical protein
VGECTLSIGGQRIVRSQGLLDAEYALFDIGDIELRASAPGSVREHSYKTTVEQALERLAAAGVTREVVLSCTQAMQPVLADAYARGPAVRRIARLLRAEELFEARTYNAETHRYEGTFLDLTQLATDLGYGAAPTALQVVHIAAVLLGAKGDAEVELNSADHMKDRRPGERSFKRVSLEAVPELCDALKEHAARGPKPTIAAIPRHELTTILEERARGASSNDAKARIAALIAGADVSEPPTKGPLSDPGLWEIELLLDDGQVERASGRIDAIETAQGRDPGTTYLRARVALLQGSDAPDTVAHRAAELSSSMGGFPEAELLAADAWSRAGDMRKAGAFARDVADAGDTPLLLREKARAILDRVRASGVSMTGLPPGIPAANRTTMVEPRTAPRAPSRPPTAPPAPMDLRTPSGAPRPLDDLPPVLSLFGGDDELPFSREPSGGPPRASVVPTVRRPTGDMFLAAPSDPQVPAAPPTGVAVAKVQAPSRPSTAPAVERSSKAPNLWPDSRAEPEAHVLGPRGPGAPLVPEDLRSRSAPPARAASASAPAPAPEAPAPEPLLSPRAEATRPLLSSLPPNRRSSDTQVHAQPGRGSGGFERRRTHNSIPMSALPLAPLSMQRPSDSPREASSDSFMRGASLAAITIDPNPPALPKAPLLPKPTGAPERASELSLPAGLTPSATLALDTLPRSVIEARIQFIMLTRELGARYQSRQGLDLRMDLSGLEAVQHYLAEAYPKHVVRSPEEAYDLRMHGAFLSELLARTLDADWIDIDHQDLGHWVMLVPSDARVHPFGRVLRYVAQGARERDLVSFYFELQTRKRA